MVHLKGIQNGWTFKLVAHSVVDFISITNYFQLHSTPKAVFGFEEAGLKLDTW